MSETAARASRLWSAVMRRGPYVLLAAGAVLAVLTAGEIGSRADLVPIGVLVAAAAGLHWWMVDRRWTGEPAPTASGCAYLAARWAIAFALTWLNPLFAVFAVMGYFDAHLYVPRRWGWLALTATAVTMAGSQSGGLPPAGALQWVGFAALFVLNAGLALLFGRIAAHETDLAAERTATIAELAAANARLAEALAENAALQAQLLAQARLAGVRDERERLALEIHDTIAQNLTGVVTQLQAAAELADPQAARAHRERAAALAREALGEVRRAVRGLVSSRLEQATLPDALGGLAADWSAATGVDCRLVVTGEPAVLPREVEMTVLRVAQESLANVARHARAGRVGVTLSYMGSELTLDVRDDGVGFTPPPPGPLEAAPAGAGGGVGLRGMRQRAARLAGELVVESEPGAGTAVSLRLPTAAPAPCGQAAALAGQAPGRDGPLRGEGRPQPSVWSAGSPPDRSPPVGSSSG